MLYEMVTGARAFLGTSTADTLSAVIRAQPKAPSAVVPGIPSDLEKAILRCLRKDPQRRYQHIDDVKVGTSRKNRALAPWCLSVRFVGFVPEPSLPSLASG
jgi:serine/threonine protein kinase